MVYGKPRSSRTWLTSKPASAACKRISDDDQRQRSVTELQMPIAM